MQAKKFRSRVDYIDMAVFGVNHSFDDFDNVAEEIEEIELEIHKYSSHYGRLVERLKVIENKLIKYQY